MTIFKRGQTPQKTTRNSSWTQTIMPFSILGATILITASLLLVAVGHTPIPDDKTLKAAAHAAALGVAFTGFPAVLITAFRHQVKLSEWLMLLALTVILALNCAAIATAQPDPRSGITPRLLSYITVLIASLAASIIHFKAAARAFRTSDTPGRTTRH